MRPIQAVRAAAAALLVLLGPACASPAPGRSDAGGELDAAAVRQLVEAAFAVAVPSYYLDEQAALPLRVRGVAGGPPARAAGLPVVAYDAPGDYPRRYTLEVVSREGPRLVARLVIDNPIGGPSVYDLEAERTAAGWGVRVLGATEHL